MTATKEKYLCCRSGPIRVSVTLQKQVYHPGEQIVFSVEVDNSETNKRLGVIHAGLMTNYTVFGKSGKVKGSCSDFGSFLKLSLLTESVQGGSKEKWQDRTVNIPEDTTPSFDNCQCIHLDYKFVVYVEISSIVVVLNTEVSVPVVLIIPNEPQTAQPVSQSHGRSKDMPGLATSHFLHAFHSPSLRYPPSTRYPLKSITQQPTGTIEARDFTYV